MPLHENEDIRVGALNINWLSFNNNASVTADVLLRSARENELDVLLLQEYKSHWQLDEKAFSKLFKVNINMCPYKGNVHAFRDFRLRNIKGLSSKTFQTVSPTLS